MFDQTRDPSYGPNISLCDDFNSMRLEARRFRSSLRTVCICIGDDGRLSRRHGRLRESQSFCGGGKTYIQVSCLFLPCVNVSLFDTSKDLMLFLLVVICHFEQLTLSSPPIKQIYYLQC